MSSATGTQARQNAVAPVGYIELLRRNRDFRRVWLGQVVSQLGDWFDTIAVYTLALRLTGSGSSISLILVARFLPSVVMGPLSGVVADRFNRRRVMIVSDLLRAVVVLGFLFVRRPEQVWMIYALTVLQLSLSSFFEPARTAAIPSLVEERELVTANALSSITWSAMLTLGAAIGGIATDAFGLRAAFVLDSLTYLVSALLVVSVRLPKRPPRAKTKLTLGKALGITDTLEGLRYVRRRRRVLAFLLVKPAWGLGGGILSLLAVFGERVFPVGGPGRVATGIGILFTARGIGTALGPMLARRVAAGTRAAMQSAIGISFIFAGVFYVAFGVSKNFALALVVLALAHMGGSTLWVFSTVLLQSSVEDEFRGRVFAAEMMLMTLAMAASNYATGVAMDSFGYSPRAVTVAIGILFTMPGVVWFLTRRWWDKEAPWGKGKGERGMEAGCEIIS
ncbi:MAG: MFS transporter [Acidobacteria bacterium]|nr:MFS transporter [Acidobacteriota bacterium]